MAIFPIEIACCFCFGQADFCQCPDFAQFLKMDGEKNLAINPPWYTVRNDIHKMFYTGSLYMIYGGKYIKG